MKCPNCAKELSQWYDDTEGHYLLCVHCGYKKHINNAPKTLQEEVDLMAEAMPGWPLD